MTFNVYLIDAVYYDILDKANFCVFLTLAKKKKKKKIVMHICLEKYDFNECRISSLKCILHSKDQFGISDDVLSHISLSDKIGLLWFLLCLIAFFEVHFCLWIVTPC